MLKKFPSDSSLLVVLKLVSCSSPDSQLELLTKTMLKDWYCEGVDGDHIRECKYGCAWTVLWSSACSRQWGSVHADISSSWPTQNSDVTTAHQSRSWPKFSSMFQSQVWFHDLLYRLLCAQLSSALICIVRLWLSTQLISYNWNYVDLNSYLNQIHHPLLGHHYIYSLLTFQHYG